MQDHYQIVTEDVKKDNGDILATLVAIKDGKLSNDLRLLNYYQSIPVNYGARIAHVDRDMVELEVHQQQAIVMHIEKLTFLKSSHFPKDVLASVSYVNVDKCKALVTKFTYAVIRSERRQFVRVQVVEPIGVVFSSETGSLSGMLNDISLGGLAFFANVATPPENGVKGTVDLKLPGGACEMPGQLLKRVDLQEKSLYILEIQMDSKVEKAISQYIFQRQVEIIRELKDSVI